MNQNAPLQIDVALVPQAAYGWNERTCILVDVLSASSTMVAILEAGARQILPVPSLRRARALSSLRDSVLAGEDVHGLAPPGFEFTNTPIDFLGRDLSGKRVILCSTNGTRVLSHLRSSCRVSIGALVNSTAVAVEALAYARHARMPLGVVCCGFQGEFGLDDAVGAGQIVETVMRQALAGSIPVDLSESAEAVRRLRRSFTDLREPLAASLSGKRILLQCLDRELEYCAQIDASKLVPVLLRRPAGLVIKPAAGK
jgi:2-phosphosulfolactate phosphatase